jgi:hypothetical protein
MTSGACYIYKFVLNILFIRTIQWFVALIAGHSLMFSVEFKPRTFVTEFLCFPVIKRMASLAIVLSLSFKLFIVDIGVAAFTFFLKIPEILHNVISCLFEMTAPAGVLCMFPQQREVRL